MYGFYDVHYVKILMVNFNTQAKMLKDLCCALHRAGYNGELDLKNDFHMYCNSLSICRPELVKEADFLKLDDELLVKVQRRF